MKDFLIIRLVLPLVSAVLTAIVVVITTVLFIAGTSAAVEVYRHL